MPILNNVAQAVQNQQRINGLIHDFSSVNLTVNDLSIQGIKSINWTENQEHTLVYGSGMLPLGITPGQWAGSGSLEMYLLDFQKLSASMTDWFLQEFSISIVYSLAGTMGVTEDLSRCYFLNRGASQSTGNDALTRTMDFICLDPVKVDKRAAIENSDIFGDIMRGVNLAGGAASILKNL